MDINTQHLPFWHFFHDLEKQLSYERWIDKYKLFLGQLFDTGYLDQGPGDHRQLSQLCKALYLQDIRDEKRFENMFLVAWNKEREYWERTFQAMRQQVSQEEPPMPPGAPESPHRSEKEPEKKPAETALSDLEKRRQETEQQVLKQNNNTKEYYYNPPPLPGEDPANATVPSETRYAKREFNLLDEYFLTTRREMNKAWQYLRHEDKGDLTVDIDIPATVSKLARETIFTEPVYVTGKKNREDTLLIFVDCNGSMVPFHELCRRLVNSAKGFGGHKHAEVYYFQNYPSGYVYRTHNLTKPRKLVEAFISANKQFTTAVIISDAGFARGYSNEKKYEVRLKNLRPFFQLLSKHCARTLWLNPMPENRWHKSTAQAIQEQILRMAPVLEKGMNTFQNIMRNMIKAIPIQ